MPTKYIVPVIDGNERDNTLMKVFNGRIMELEKLQETRMQAIESIRIQQGNRTLWNQQKNLEN
jgi:hypothetical protein